MTSTRITRSFQGKGLPTITMSALVAITSVACNKAPSEQEVEKAISGFEKLHAQYKLEFEDIKGEIDIDDLAKSENALKEADGQRLEANSKLLEFIRGDKILNQIATCMVERKSELGNETLTMEDMNWSAEFMPDELIATEAEMRLWAEMGEDKGSCTW